MYDLAALFLSKSLQTIAMKQLSIKKFDDELQVVYGEVYAPGFPDSQGDFMTLREVQKMAHRFLAKGAVDAVDQMHDNVKTGSTVVESFIAREDDSIYLPGAWVVGIHIPNRELWNKVKSGEYNGFSLEGPVFVHDAEIELELPEVIVGKTDGDDHQHEYEVKFSEDGTFLGGVTSVVKGHYHVIKRGTVTELDGDPRHAHRYSFIDEVIGREEN